MIDRLAILAPGLLGASVARGARERGLAREIVLWARRPEARSALAAQPWCDRAAETPETAAAGAALVVIAAPVDRIAPLAAQIAPHLADRALVTDVGSVKAAICRDAGPAVARLSGGRATFIGSHPMAGSEKTGWEHGSGALFQDRTCFVTPVTEADGAAAPAVEAFWTSLGAKPVRVAPEEHDRIVAHISHLPQLAASTLAAFLERTHPAWGAYAGNGLRDTTRIAASDPELWTAIFAANRKAILEAVRSWQEDLAAAERALAAGDDRAFASLLARGRDFRRRL
ncbi:MAG TPA: prephenate dehydrogenase/arogenate dehydrogenase family protein [Opitutaceae bacterium]|nr:prephenate dehydrogenase/arogenate dehydrogenase family protein [Opitutaceae bacterium]